MNAVTYFDTSGAGVSGQPSINKYRLENKQGTYPIATGILTGRGAKKTGLPIRKIKKSASKENHAISTIPGNQNTKIAYITVKKNKKCLTFDYSCVRNNLL